jgi:hypothetical protein
MKSHNNVWQAFLKILDRMEIRQVPWRSQKMNSKWRLHNNWWPFLKISDQMKKQMFHEVPPKKKKLTVHTVSTPSKHSSKHGTKWNQICFVNFRPPLQKDIHSPHSITTLGRHSSKYGTKWQLHCSVISLHYTQNAKNTIIWWLGMAILCPCQLGSADWVMENLVALVAS